MLTTFLVLFGLCSTIPRVTSNRVRITVFALLLIAHPFSASSSTTSLFGKIANSSLVILQIMEIPAHCVKRVLMFDKGFFQNLSSGWVSLLPQRVRNIFLVQFLTRGVSFSTQVLNTAMFLVPPIVEFFFGAQYVPLAHAAIDATAAAWIFNFLASIWWLFMCFWMPVQWLLRLWNLIDGRSAKTDKGAVVDGLDGNADAVDVDGRCGSCGQRIR